MLSSKTLSSLSPARIRFFSTGALMNLQYDITQIQRESFFPAHPFDTQYLFLYKEVTSSICTSVAILATVIRLFMRRLIFWFDDVSRFPGSSSTYQENLFVNEYIGVRSIEHDIPNCSYGNHCFHKCVINCDELQLIHVNRTLDRTIQFCRLLRHNLYNVLLYCLVVTMDSVWK